MAGPQASDTDRSALNEGEPPESVDVLRYLEAPQPGWSEFLRREYLTDFIAAGGAKLKLLVGRPGTGKSHLLRLAAGTAREEGYLVAELCAFGARLFPIDRLYGAVMRAVSLPQLELAYARRVVQELGFDSEELPARGTFFDTAVHKGWAAEATLRRSLREQIDMLLRDDRLDPTFAVGVAQAVGHRLGLFHLNEQERDALGRWFHAEKVALGELRALQIYERVDRYTARAYLRSLAVFARLAGYRGLVVCVDQMETLAHRSANTGAPRYTRGQRDEAYETIRQLIDDVDRTRATLFLLAARREFLEDERAGISSYEALRLRLLKEVTAERFNPFADIVDLDAARASGFLSNEALAEWLDRLNEYRAGQPGSAHPPPHLSLRDLVLAQAAA